MPPTPGLYVGRDQVLRNWSDEGFGSLPSLRAVSTSVNRQPAVAVYAWQEEQGAYAPLTVDVLRIVGDQIAEIITFHADQFPRLGLPGSLPVVGA